MNRLLHSNREHDDDGPLYFSLTVLLVSNGFCCDCVAHQLLDNKFR